jgi:hypothetical protein
VEDVGVRGLCRSSGDLLAPLGRNLLGGGQGGYC